MLVFKGKPNERIDKELEKYPLVESKQVFACWHKKACNNVDIMRKWVNAVWRRYDHFKLKRIICSLWMTHLCVRYQK